MTVFDTSSARQNYHYARGDPVFINVEKSNFNYYPNTVYRLNKWNFLLGYKLNSKNWFDSPFNVFKTFRVV